MNTAVAAFLGKHNFPVHQDINSVIDALLFDMHEGLSGRPAGEDMIRTFCTPPSKTAANESVIVIDAGGTNFRSCLVTFDANCNPVIEFMEKTKMPGIERELSRKEFFEQFAENLEHLKDKSTNIGFCFSYPMTITEDGDGVLIGFSKEIKAPEVVGCHIGKELAKALSAHGWKNKMHISLLNDTVAALLAGAATAANGKRYSSYVGFILGTGMNSAYIQPADPRYKGLKEQIIVCESGKFSAVSCSDFDIAYDKKSIKPGSGIMEKHCSGAYLGPLSYEVIHAAAAEGLFSKKFSDSLLQLEGLTQIEMDSFLHAPYNTSSVLGAKAAACADDEDYGRLFELLDAVVERTARMAAALLAAAVIKSGKGTCANLPVCLLCDGTSFYKTYKVRSRVEAYLEDVLVRQRGLYYEVVSCDNDITLGSAIGGLIKNQAQQK
ncbi:MAG TPA: hexokinase [Treponema sp.]|nr:hexokinase [Treponema sp.]